MLISSPLSIKSASSPEAQRRTLDVFLFVCTYFHQYQATITRLHAANAESAGNHRLITTAHGYSTLQPATDRPSHPIVALDRLIETQSTSSTVMPEEL